MTIKLDDLFITSPKKEKRHTVVVDASLDQLIGDVRRNYGKRNAAEIMRRALREGLTQALERVSDDQAS